METTASACPALLFAKPAARSTQQERRSVRVARRRRTRAKRGQWAIDRAVYGAVDARDGLRCRACGSPHLIERDHIRPRSLGGQTTTENVADLCRACHQLKTLNVLRIEKTTSAGADGLLAFTKDGATWTS